jgi:hypothetical protein
VGKVYTSAQSLKNRNGRVWCGMAISVLFSKKEVCLRKVVFKRSGG